MGNYKEGEISLLLKEDPGFRISEQMVPNLNFSYYDGSDDTNHSYVLGIIVTCCTKSIDVVNNDEFRKIIDFYKPYLIDNHPNLIGRLSDEDGYIDMDIFIDEEKFNKEQEDRLYICDGCSRMNSKRYCDRWSSCLRAYNINR